MVQKNLSPEEFAKSLGGTVSIKSKLDPDAYAKSLGGTVSPTLSTIPKEPGYFQRVGSEYMKAAEDFSSAFGKAITPPKVVKGDLLASGKNLVEKVGIDVPRAVLRGLGGVAGTVYTPIVEAPGIKQTLELAGSKVEDLSKTKPIQKIAQYSQPFADTLLKTLEENPELGKDIKNIVDIYIVGKGLNQSKLLPKEKSIITKTGEKLTKSGEKAAITQKEKFIRELIRPEQTKAIKESQVARTTEKGIGPFKRSIIAPTVKDLESEKVVINIPKVGSNKTVQQNYNIISKYNTEEAVRLEKLVEKNNFKVPYGETELRLARAGNELLNNPLITGDAEKTAQKLITKANQIIRQNEETGKGLLKAKKEYDIWVKRFKPNAFDAKAESAFTESNREIRNAFKDLLEERAPTLGIKKSLKKQSSLYNALDNLTPKAAIEADTAIGRGFQRIGKVLGTKNKVVQGVAAAAGIGGLGAAATFAPLVAVTGIPVFLIYKGGKLVLKPQVRTAIGKILNQTGSKLGASDRNYLIGILNDYAE